MKKYFFEVEYTDGKIKRFDVDDILVALWKQRDWVKKAMRDGRIDKVSNVMLSQGKLVNEKKVELPCTKTEFECVIQL